MRNLITDLFDHLSKGSWEHISQITPLISPRGAFPTEADLLEQLCYKRETVSDSVSPVSSNLDGGSDNCVAAAGRDPSCNNLSLFLWQAEHPTISSSGTAPM